MELTKNVTQVIIIAGLVMISLRAQPHINTGISPEATETEKTIKDYFKFPQVVMPVSGSQKVEVLFTTDQKGQVDFVLAKTTDQNLKVEIEKQFLKLNLAKLKCDVVHSVILNIKTV